MSPGAANLFPFFSEENNPLYLDPAERAANEASQAQGNRDTVSKRTKREVRSRARSPAPSSSPTPYPSASSPPRHPSPSQRTPPVPRLASPPSPPTLPPAR
jgi:hypothetical protein